MVMAVFDDGWARDNPEGVPNATRHCDNNDPHSNVTWERDLPADGYVHVYSGAWNWRWFVVCRGRQAISAQIYGGPSEAMRAGQDAFDRILHGAATIPCEGCHSDKQQTVPMGPSEGETIPCTCCHGSGVNATLQKVSVR
jgi:hypothetical protein